jgi:hypothetical protein
MNSLAHHPKKLIGKLQAMGSLVLTCTMLWERGTHGTSAVVYCCRIWSTRGNDTTLATSVITSTKAPEPWLMVNRKLVAGGVTRPLPS